MEQVKCFIPETLEEALRIRKGNRCDRPRRRLRPDGREQHGRGRDARVQGVTFSSSPISKELKGIRELPDGSVEIGACTTSAGDRPLAHRARAFEGRRVPHGRDRSAQQRDHRRQHRQRVPQRAICLSRLF